MKSKRGLIAKIHIGKQQLLLDDDTYRALLQRETGKDSCSKMDLIELESVVKAMQKQGFKPVTKYGHRPNPRQSLQSMMDKVEAILTEQNLHWNYAHGMAKRMFGVDQVQWLDDADLHKLVAALQMHANRRNSEASQ